MTVILARLIALARVYFSGRRSYPGVSIAMTRMQRLPGSRGSRSRSPRGFVRTTDPPGKKLIAFTNALTSAVFSFVPASRAEHQAGLFRRCGLLVTIRAPVIAPRRYPRPRRSD